MYRGGDSGRGVEKCENHRKWLRITSTIAPLLRQLLSADSPVSEGGIFYRKTGWARGLTAWQLEISSNSLHKPDGWPRSTSSTRAENHRQGQAISARLWFRRLGAWVISLWAPYALLPTQRDSKVLMLFSGYRIISYVCSSSWGLRVLGSYLPMARVRKTKQRTTPA